LFEKGYNIDIVLTKLDEHTAVRRVGDKNDPEGRANKTGRFVPPNVITKSRNLVDDKEIIDRYHIEGVKNVYVVDTSNQDVITYQLIKDSTVQPQSSD
jgi:hypothetical protein